MRYAFWIAIAASVFFGVLAFDTATTIVSRLALDVSWPNCNAKIQDQYVYGIVGVTGGLNFRKNACVAEEASWFQHFALYMNTGYPGISYGKKYQDTPKRCAAFDNNCLAYNWGYNAALYAVNYASIQNVHAQSWWLDVESVNSWSADGYVNRQSLIGAVAAIRHELFLPSIGFYAYPGQWVVLTDNWQNGFPAWTATGSSDPLTAAQACSPATFTAGPAVMAQYTKTYDIDVICKSAVLGTAGDD